MRAPAARDPAAGDTPTRTDRLRAAAKRRLLWPAARQVVGTFAWELGLVASAALAGRLPPGRRTDAAPLALRWIDPDRPIYDALPPVPERPPIGRVESGDWDRIDDRFAERAVPRAIRLRYRNGRDWVETPLPAHVRAQCERFGDAWGHVDGTVERRCREIEALYEAMNVEGYRTQADLAARGDGGPGPPPIPTLGEITVDVGRDGRLCWRGNGQHRLAIARVLGIERVPVLVARRHAGWQAVRDRIRTDGTQAVDSSLWGHPDLAELQGVVETDTD